MAEKRSKPGIDDPQRMSSLIGYSRIPGESFSAAGSFSDDPLAQQDSWTGWGSEIAEFLHGSRPLGKTPRVPSAALDPVRLSLVTRVERWLGGALARMSDEEVLRVVEAQSPAETIAEILIATPETRAASENDWAELLLRGAEAKNQIAELVGGLLSSSEAAAVLGISVPGVKQRMDRHKLLAVPLAGGQWGFPARQFQEGGPVRPGVPEVAKAGAGLDTWTVLSILVDDVPDGSATLLERLDDPAVLGDVIRRLETYGEHIAG